MALINKLTAIADAIRSKTGSTEPLTLDDMAEAINGISVGGDDETGVLESVLDRSVASITSNATSIGFAAFYGCSNLTVANFPALTTVGEFAFNTCSNLAEINAPLITTIKGDAFSASGILSVDFAQLTTIRGGAFSACSKLKSVHLPLVSSMGSSAFNGCTALSTVDLSSVTSLGNGCFAYCSTLKTFILRSNTLCSLSNVNVFTGTPITNGTGYIYVPRALIDSYKSDTNWSNFANQFRALEDYTVDGTITGELDESKI